MIDPLQCPLCAQPNGCQICYSSAKKDPCWCSDVVIPPELIARVPESHRNKACICPECVHAFHREMAPRRPSAKVTTGDFYFENGFLVFTAQYHRKRGFCCGNGCRHCPYPKVDSLHR